MQHRTKTATADRHAPGTDGSDPLKRKNVPSTTAQAAEVHTENTQANSEIETLREQLRLKEAALVNRRAVLAQTETRLNNEVQELTVELTHERQRRQKRERELHNALAEVAAMRDLRAPAEAARDHGDSNTHFNDSSSHAQRVHKGRWRYSLSKKRRWNSS